MSIIRGSLHQYIIDAADHLSSPYGGYFLQIQGDNEIEFRIYTASGCTNVVSTTQIEIDNWYHIAGVYDGYAMRLYINGICEDINYINEDIQYSTDHGMYIGCNIQYFRHFKGIIDEVRISNYPRSFHEDTDGDGMSDMYEIMRSPFSDQYNPMEHNGRYALLICPRPHNQEDFDCFWSDPKFFYDALKSYGYHDEDIYLLYDTGNDIKAGKYGTPPGVTYTDSPATPDELESICLGLSSFVQNTDFLFVFTFDHGDRSGANSRLGMNDGAGFTAHIQDDELAGALYLGNINYKYRVIFMQQCFSGGFIDDLSNAKTTTATACRGDELALPATGDGDEVEDENGEFNFYFMSAFAGRTPTNGVHIDADNGGDSRDISNMISIYEAYKWEEDHENRAETPQWDDDGDGDSQQDGDFDEPDLGERLYL